MTVSVIIPTYRRPQDLFRCLKALQTQTHQADEVIVVMRDSDEDTRDFLRDFPKNGLLLKVVTVDVPGVVAAMNVGLAEVKGEVTALVDDDAAPRPDWLARIDALFASDNSIGGVGGRDWVYHGQELEDGARSEVGKVRWYGRTIGSHHLGVGGPREVELLKGVNCAYRTDILRGIGFDTRLRGQGAQVHWELSLGLSLRRRGWKLIYDPAIAVDHYPSQRFDEDQRQGFNAEAQSNAVHNETLALLDYLPRTRHGVFLTWALLIGTATTPGAIQTVRLLFRNDQHAWRRMMATIAGRIAGMKTFRQLSPRKQVTMMESKADSMLASEQIPSRK